MSNRWYKEAVIYCVEVDPFQDSDGDGCGDLQGLISRLDYLSRLGRDLPVAQPDPPDARCATPATTSATTTGSTRGWAASATSSSCCREAEERGIRILLDLVVNHTSDQHPWFRSARSSPDSPYRDWYVWSDTEPPDRFAGDRLPRRADARPGPGTTEAEAWYFHRFYDFQPDLNWSNPDVRARDQEGHGASGCSWAPPGFRIDAAPFVLEQVARRRSTRHRRTSRSSTTGARTCSGTAATPCCSARPTSTPTRSPQYCAAGARRARTTGRTCCSPSG